MTEWQNDRQDKTFWARSSITGALKRPSPKTEKNLNLIKISCSIYATAMNGSVYWTADFNQIEKKPVKWRKINKVIWKFQVNIVRLWVKTPCTHFIEFAWTKAPNFVSEGYKYAVSWNDALANECLESCFGCKPINYNHMIQVTIFLFLDNLTLLCYLVFHITA